ncbi:hypothetical protein ES707_06728 [subsurface metagenome]
MQITGIEVIRHNPGVAAIGVPVGEKLSVSVGDTVRVHMTVDYRGLAVDGAIWTAIGWQTGVIIPEFIEVFNSRTPVHFDESIEFVTYPIDCDVEITDIFGYLIEFGLYGNVLDMYAKIMEVPGPDIFTDIYMGAIEVMEVKPPPVYELMQETIYPFSYVYDGDVEVSTFTFKSDPFTPAAWLAQKFAKAAADEVEKEGGRLLEIRVYVDKTPLLWTNWKIEVIGTPLGATAGIGVAIPIWAAILIAALAIIGVIVTVTWAIKTITEAFTHKPISEEIKKAMSREALITLIGDFELKLEQELTPPEALEGMSDQELRDYCDQLAEEIAPPPTPWAVLAAVGALVVLGGGAALAFTMAKPEK